MGIIFQPQASSRLLLSYRLCAVGLVPAPQCKRAIACLLSPWAFRPLPLKPNVCSFPGCYALTLISLCLWHMKILTVAALLPLPGHAASSSVVLYDFCHLGTSSLYKTEKRKLHRLMCHTLSSVTWSCVVPPPHTNTCSPFPCVPACLVSLVCALDILCSGHFI